MKQIFCYILLLLLIFFKKSSLTLCMKRQFPNSDATIATCSFIIIKCLILFNSLHTMKGSKHYLLSLNAYNTVKVFLVQCYTFLVQCYTIILIYLRQQCIFIILCICSYMHGLNC
jgi:hypothetical protein